MNKAPLEIWQNIFSLACRDAGHTGRALSLVSKPVRDISAPVKLQSIAIHGWREITAFACVLDHTPLQLRRVRFLRVDGWDDPKAGGLADVWDSSDSDESDYGQHEIALIQFNPYERQERKIAKEVQGILNVVKENVEFLELFSGFDISQQFNHSCPIRFTRLKDLKVFSTATFTSTNNTMPIFAPCCTLRRLHISSNWTCDDGVDLMGCISTFAPALTHLQFSIIDEDGDCHYLRHLPAALGLEAFPGTSTTTRLPESLKKVVIRIWTRGRRRYMRYFGPGGLSIHASGVEVASHLSDLATKDDRLLFWRNEYVREQEESRWQRRVDGREDEWVSLETVDR